jgi:hypothetical protein
MSVIPGTDLRRGDVILSIYDDPDYSQHTSSSLRLVLKINKVTMDVIHYTDIYWNRIDRHNIVRVRFRADADYFVWKRDEMYSGIALHGDKGYCRLEICRPVNEYEKAAEQKEKIRSSILLGTEAGAEKIDDGLGPK